VLLVPALRLDSRIASNSTGLLDNRSKTGNDQVAAVEHLYS
jgi:hypothetical protein